MRVIAGTARSIPLIAPEGMDTRPTTDRIKETLFNMLQFELQGCRFADLFAGSGAIGIEALSRGAQEAAFADNSKKAAACIEANLKKCQFTERSMLLQTEVLAAVSRLAAVWKREETDENAPEHIVFLDPPYGKGLEFPVLRALVETGLVREGDRVIVETSLKGDLTPAEGYGYEIVKEKKYKNQKHVFLRLRAA